MVRPFELHLGDCIDVMRSLESCSVDAIVTDPPYGIRFMGKAWDGADIESKAEARRAALSHAPDASPVGGHKSIAAEAGKYDLTPVAMRAFQEFSREWAIEAMRVLKPGGHLLSFSSARTYHRMTSGIEDAGFEIRDQIMWVFGSGFPKSLDVSKAIDAQIARGQAGEATSDNVAKWGGWGTALKPAHEPICVARKPLAKGMTVAANVLAFGTGGINIDACRIGTDDTRSNSYKMTSKGIDGGGFGSGQMHSGARDGSIVAGSACGRFPANLIHDGSAEVIQLFPDSKAGSSVSGDVPSEVTNGIYGKFSGRTAFDGFNDAGSAARFFYCPKASRPDRNSGLIDPGPQFKRGSLLRQAENLTEKKGNFHPTVKPTDLMQYLIRLVVPTGGVVLDPFLGSGSTGKAAMREGVRFIGIELDSGYMELAMARIEHEYGVVLEQSKEAAKAASQLDLF